MGKTGPRGGPSGKLTARQARLDASMGYLVRQTHRAFTHALERRLARHGVSISMWFFLRLLWEGDGRSQKELSNELALAPATTVHAMDKLEERGLVTRKRNGEDRRKLNIHLTPSGWALERVLSPYANEADAIATGQLTAEGRRAVISALHCMKRALDEEVGGS